MPVTARLSRLFYERLGEEIANELVEWFNAVDATYRADLRELNELNFARFDAKLEQRLAELRSEFRSELHGEAGKLRGEMGAGLGALRAEMADGFGALRAEMHDLKAELIKWMFLFWAGTALGGLLLKALG